MILAFRFLGEFCQLRDTVFTGKFVEASTNLGNCAAHSESIFMVETPQMGGQRPSFKNRRSANVVRQIVRSDFCNLKTAPHP